MPQHPRPPATVVKHIITTSFQIWIVLSALFTAAGGVVSLYGSDKKENCRLGVQIASTVLQGLSVIFSLISVAIVGLKKMMKKNKKSVNATKDKGPQTTLRWKLDHLNPSTLEFLQAILQLITNIACLVMVILIITTKGGCINFVFNALYNIFGVIGSFIVTLIGSFKTAIQKRKHRSRENPVNRPKDIHHPHHHHHHPHSRRHHHHHRHHRIHPHPALRSIPRF